MLVERRDAAGAGCWFFRFSKTEDLHLVRAGFSRILEHLKGGGCQRVGNRKDPIEIARGRFAEPLGEGLGGDPEVAAIDRKGCFPGGGNGFQEPVSSFAAGANPPAGMEDREVLAASGEKYPGGRFPAGEILGSHIVAGEIRQAAVDHDHGHLAFDRLAEVNGIRVVINGAEDDAVHPQLDAAAQAPYLLAHGVAPVVALHQIQDERAAPCVERVLDGAKGRLVESDGEG